MFSSLIFVFRGEIAFFLGEKDASWSDSVAGGVRAKQGAACLRLLIIAPWMLPGCCLGAPWAHPGCTLDAIWRHLGCMLEAPQKHPGWAGSGVAKAGCRPGRFGWGRPGAARLVGQAARATSPPRRAEGAPKARRRRAGGARESPSKPFSVTYKKNKKKYFRIHVCSTARLKLFGTSFSQKNGKVRFSNLRIFVFGVFEQNLKDFLLRFHLERALVHCMESPFEVRIPLIQIDDVQINLNSN